MANITRIKAKDPNKSEKKSESTSKKVAKPATITKKSPKEIKKLDKKQKKAEKHSKKSEQKSERAAKHPKLHKVVRIITTPLRIIAFPFVKLGKYIANSWREIRQVRWPNRKATWKMVLAVFVYTAIFVAFIMLVDALLTLLFNNFLK